MKVVRSKCAVSLGWQAHDPGEPVVQFQFESSWRPNSANGADKVCILFWRIFSYFKERQFFCSIMSLNWLNEAHHIMENYLLY